MERAAPPCGSFIFAGWPVLIGWARWERDGINAAIIQKSSELRGPDSAPIITRIPRNGAVERWLPKWIIYPAVNWTRKTHPENWIWPPRPRPWRGSKVMEYAGTCWNMLEHAGTCWDMETPCLPWIINWGLLRLWRRWRASDGAQVAASHEL